MKKIIIAIISAMILMPTMANAQIKKTGENKTQTIASLRMGIVSLNHSNNGYYIAFHTTNQFDDAMILKIGDDKDSAIQSLKDLIDILETLQGDETQYIDNGYGREFRLWKMMGTLYISADGYAGNGNVSKGELNRLLKALQK